MVFIRQVRTGSGATAVQIVDYVGGRQQIIEHVGSAHTDAELGVLWARARELMVDPAHLALDIEAESVPPVARLVPPAAPATLFDVDGGERSRRGRAGAGRVLGTDARVLFSSLAAVYADLGFDALRDEVFRDLVLARVVEPTSLLDSARVLTDLGRRPASYATMKRTLKRAQQAGYRDDLASWCFEHAASAGDISLVLYDVTTLLCRRRHKVLYADLPVMPMPCASMLAVA